MIDESVYLAAAEAMMADVDVSAEPVEADPSVLARQRAWRAAVDVAFSAGFQAGRINAAQEIVKRDDADGAVDMNVAYWAALKIGEEGGQKYPWTAEGQAAQ